MSSEQDVLISPKLSEVADFIRKSVVEKKFLILVADCEIVYKGRSSSKLTEGERLIILKPDGAFLVHRPRGYEPVNWQPSGSIASVYTKEDYLLLRVIRPKPSEVLDVKLYSVKLAASFHLRDEGAFSMIGDEKDMQKAVQLEPSLVEPGLKIVKLERKTRPGFIDVLAVDKAGRLVVIELKRGRADVQAVLQLKRYVDALKNELGREIRGILAAPSLTKKAQSLLSTLNLEFRPLTVEKCIEVLKKREGLLKFMS